MNNKPKYLVRPHDSHIFELDETNGCYRSWNTRKITYADGTRPNAMSHFTFDNLTINYDFFPIEENEIEEYQKKNKLYNKWLSWSNRSDGHGGVKGGTMEEYLEYIEKLKLFNALNVQLKRSDLTNDYKEKPLNDIDIFHFKNSSLTRKEIAKAETIVFIDDDGNSKILKSRD